MVFVYDFHPGSETLMLRHFAHSAHHMNGYNNPFSVDGGARPFSAKGGRGSMYSFQLECNLMRTYSSLVPSP